MQYTVISHLVNHCDTFVFVKLPNVQREACDLQRFCGDGMFPAEVFGGPQRWSNDEVLMVPRETSNDGMFVLFVKW